jgi:hypothetical protein
MYFKGAEGSDGKSATLAFVCQKCGNSVSMLANQKEGELIRSLGIKVMESKAPHNPTGTMQNTVSWDGNAEAHLSNIPEFARPMAKAGVERYATQKGYKSITVEVMAEARKVYGM